MWPFSEAVWPRKTAGCVCERSFHNTHIVAPGSVGKVKGLPLQSSQQGLEDAPLGKVDISRSRTPSSCDGPRVANNDSNLPMLLMLRNDRIMPSHCLLLEKVKHYESKRVLCANTSPIICLQYWHCGLKDVGLSSLTSVSSPPSSFQFNKSMISRFLSLRFLLREVFGDAA